MNSVLLSRLQRMPAVHALLQRRAVSYYEQFSHHLAPLDRILDIGCGPGFFTNLLRQHHLAVVPLDVYDTSYLPHVRPILYDGLEMSFENLSFDCALLITVLHHTLEPARVLAEAARVASRLIIVEDVILNRAHRRLTWGLDTLFNLEFSGNPHNNKSDGEWRALFDALGLRLLMVKQKWSFGARWQRRSLGPINQHIYVLEAKQRPLTASAAASPIGYHTGL